MRNFTSKYISIFLLSFIIFETNAIAQKKKNKKASNKRVATRMLNRTPVTKTAVANQTETTVVETITQEESQPAIDPQLLSSKTTEIENLKSQNQLLKDKITEKQQKYNSMNSDSEDIIEKYQNLELKYNKSKNVCTSINTKQMGDIQGWLIATVAASGVGTVANTTATVTSFMQKDQTQIDKQNEKNYEKATNKAKNQEISNLEKQLKELQKQGDELTNQLGDYQAALNNANNIKKSAENNMDKLAAQTEIDFYTNKKQETLNQRNNKRSEYKENKKRLGDLQNNPYTGKVDTETIEYEQQAKKNKTLKNVSAISNIVGTVASGTSIITSSIATSLASSITKQVKKCKESF